MEKRKLLGFADSVSDAVGRRADAINAALGGRLLDFWAGAIFFISIVAALWGAAYVGGAVCALAFLLGMTAFFFQTAAAQILYLLLFVSLCFILLAAIVLAGFEAWTMFWLGIGSLLGWTAQCAVLAEREREGKK